MLAGMDDDARLRSSAITAKATRDLHPMHRAQQVIQAMNGIRQQMVENGGITMNFRSTAKERLIRRIVLNSADIRTVNEIIETMAVRERATPRSRLVRLAGSKCRVMSNEQAHGRAQGPRSRH